MELGPQQTDWGRSTGHLHPPLHRPYCTGNSNAIPPQGLPGQVSLGRPEGWPSCPRPTPCYDAGMEGCVQPLKEVRNVAPGKGRSGTRDSPGEALNPGHPFRATPNQGTGQDLCNPPRAVTGHGGLCDEEDVPELGRFLRPEIQLSSKLSAASSPGSQRQERLNAWRAGWHSTQHKAQDQREKRKL